ncbi:MAG: DUF5700 domain-containing putative Zn-dependent protease [Candidatus Heimdallarchaeaceae archaeon]
MKPSDGVKIDSSFGDLVLQYFTDPSEELLFQISEHTAASKILSNAQISDPNLKDIKDFWKKILERERNKGEEYVSEIKSCMTYIENNSEALLEHVNKIYCYLPDDFVFDCTLYLHIGYDIGIVSEGDALLNVGNEIFHQNNRELIYFALHELHHVGFTHYNNLEISFSDIQTRDDFLKLIEKLTHLEGTATYAIKEMRERDNQLSFFDYEVLNNKEKRTETTKEYFKIYDSFRYTKRIPIEERDFETLEIMSGQNKRLWYITGAHMAEQIDKKLGREELNQTILDGSVKFFEKYFSLD